jgi:hypothetical protein
VSPDARAGFDPFTTIVHLREDGRALPVTWAPDVFRKLETGGRDRVIGAKHGAGPGLPRRQ